MKLFPFALSFAAVYFLGLFQGLVAAVVCLALLGYRD
jgi:hypothetical protein